MKEGKDMTLVPFRPFRRDFLTLRDAIDRLFEESFVAARGGLANLAEGAGIDAAVDLYDTPEAYVLEASVPGFKPEDIEVTATADSIAIKGTYRTQTEVKEPSYLRQERRSGSFERTLALPLPIVPEKVEASQAEGVLKVRMPKAEATKSRRVQIKPAKAA